MSQTDLRLSLLSSWLNQYFGQEVNVSLICGDASFRRYFKLTVNNSHYIVADSPITLVPIAPFIAIAKAYRQAGVLVPEIVHYCLAQGFVLQTNVGDEQLLSILQNDNVTAYYQQALDLLVPITGVTQYHDADGNIQSLPYYDSVFVEKELTIFTEWLIGAHLQYDLSQVERVMLKDSFQLLIANVEAQPKMGMHRDFHSRNLLINHDIPGLERLGVIDFQDAVMGPVTYDAVSLLRDCYVRWPEEIVNSLMRYHYDLAIKHGLVEPNVDYFVYQQWFDLMGLQRHIKAAGIFARLKLRDGKAGYMADIPLTLQYIVDIAGRYPALKSLSDWVEQVVLPKVLAKNSTLEGGL
ncbi:aminoglycoside phosphotransferase family protein [Shewanella sp. OMA3-2]|uniref:aminoglycoside phosphotransferase family protein n=1 Tax=Shewanella sp. OMA3-2 TaxID=2908650 RepID=UPI001F403EB3|nr:phosphotransferase [Shewanella sp. OMA3-2]UJF22995.1 phosphotransferase [Shewanella sp. OMA3-2]